MTINPAALTTHDVQLESLDGLTDVDTLLLFIPEDERPLDGIAGYVDWRLCGSLSRLLLENFFTGASEDSVLLPTDGRLPIGRIMALGVGKTRALDEATLSDILKGAAEKLNKAGTAGVALGIPGAGGLGEEPRARAVLKGFMPTFRGQRVAVLAEKTLSRLLGK